MPRAQTLTHGKKVSFAECLIFDTRQTCRDRFCSVTYFFLPSVVFSSRQSLCRVPDRKHSAKTLFAGTVATVCSLPSVTLGKPFAECPWHTAKLMFPVVYLVAAPPWRRGRTSSAPTRDDARGRRRSRCACTRGTGIFRSAGMQIRHGHA